MNLTVALVMMTAAISIAPDVSAFEPPLVVYVFK